MPTPPPLPPLTLVPVPPPTVRDPRPRTASRRVAITLAAVVFVLIIFVGIVLIGVPTAFLKVFAAVLGLSGTVTQFKLAADEGPARRQTETVDQYKKRMRWRDKVDGRAWAALGASVLAVAVAEVADALASDDATCGSGA